MTLTTNDGRRTFDCEPSLTDTEVLEFCKRGFLLLEGIIDDETNRRALDYLEARRAPQPAFLPPGLTEERLAELQTTPEPHGILLEDWFVQRVLLQPIVAAVARSLLGPEVGLPVVMSNHRVETPNKALSWHNDSEHVYGPELHYLEAFYFPQDTPPELGPTEVLPGSHIRRALTEPDQAGVPCSGRAGTVGIHVQSIAHRRPASTASGVRHMLKYNYWRTTPPARNWLTEPALDLRTANFGGHHDARYFAHMYYWLCGRGEQFRVIGGQGWPWSTPNQIGPSYGFEVAEGYVPHWRRNRDGFAYPPDG